MINSFNVGLKGGGRIRPLIIQPIGVNMKLYFMNEDMLNSLKKVIDYMHEFESKHYEECDDKEKLDHIYNDVLILEKMMQRKGSIE